MSCCKSKCLDKLSVDEKLKIPIIRAEKSAPSKGAIAYDCKQDSVIYGNGCTWETLDTLRCSQELDLEIQSCDGTGFLIDGTQCWINYNARLEGDFVTLVFPPLTVQAPYDPNWGVTWSLSTANESRIPKHLCPSELNSPAINASVFTGQYIAWNLTVYVGENIPVVPPGAIITITNDGMIKISSSGSFANTFPYTSNDITVANSVAQTLPGFSITYKVKKIKKIKTNYKLSSGVNDATMLPTEANSNANRDTHVNDFYNNIAAFSWTSNSDIPDKTLPLMDIFVSVGTVNNGVLSAGPQVNLTNYYQEYLNTGLANFAWDTNVAINRNSNTIIASWSNINGGFNVNINITSPIVGSYLAKLGLASQKIFDLSNLNIVPADPLNGDSPLNNESEISGNIALIASDNFATSSTNKCFNAHIANAAAVIIYNSDSAGFIYDINGIPNIPCVSTLMSTGDLILNNQPVVGGMVNLDTTTPSLFQARSDNLGLNWSNMPLNIQPYGGSGDCLGVQADKLGNFWYGYIDWSTLDFLPVFLVSTDDGVTYTQAYKFPPLPIENAGSFYDFPIYNFGYDDQGNYGVIFSVDFINYYSLLGGSDLLPANGFIQLDPQSSPLYQTSLCYVTSLANTTQVGGVTGAKDGRNWKLGPNNSYGSQNQVPYGVMYKSPGSILENYTLVTPPMITTATAILAEFTYNYTNSQPLGGIFLTSYRTLIFDEQRQLLYALMAKQIHDYSQDMNLYFLFSANNGVSWSEPVLINNNYNGNRGFPTMQQDTANNQSGDIAIGWYDGRVNTGPEKPLLEYFAAIIPACKLDEWAFKVRRSNPKYLLGPSGTSDVPPSVPLMSDKKKSIIHKKRQDRRKFH